MSLRTLLFLVLVAFGLSACAQRPVVVQQQCQPINQYDTRCENMASAATQPKVAGPLTLTSAAHVTYELVGPAGSQANLIEYFDGPDLYKNRQKVRVDGSSNNHTDTPWRVEVDVPAYTKPLLRYAALGAVSCRITIDGVERTGETRDLGYNVHECYAN